MCYQMSRIRASLRAGAVSVGAMVIAVGCGTSGNPVAPGGTPPTGTAQIGSPASDAMADRPASSERVTICHRSQSTEAFVVISVAPAAVDSHLSHGDGRPGGPVTGQPDRVFDSRCEVSVTEDVTVGFGDLSGAGGGFTTCTESGFVVSATGPSSFTRDWEVVTTFGNPAPFVQFTVDPGSPETSGAVAISAGGATFRLSSVDLYSSVTPIPYELRGFLNGTPVFTATASVPNTFGSFETVVNPYAEVVVDSVTIVLTNPAMPACCGNAIGLDNVVLMPSM